MSSRGLDSRFLRAMRRKLMAGRQKGYVGWDQRWQDCTFSTVDECTTKWFVRRMQDEIVELITAINDQDPDAVLNECADIANFAMMCADVCRPEFAHKR